MKLPEPVAWMLNGEPYAAQQCRFFGKTFGEVIPGQVPLFSEPQVQEAIAHQTAAIQQALDHLTNLQPKLANGLLSDRQLLVIDAYVDEAIKSLKDALE